jgi:hypothetical protein
MRKGVHVASPCSVAWQEMLGDGNVRFCTRCQLNVYNFREMTEAEVDRLLVEREGKLCAKIYQRASGSILTKDSQVAFRVLPILPGSQDLHSETVDLLIGKEQPVPSEKSLPIAEPDEPGISLLAYDSMGLAASNTTFSIQNQKTHTRTIANTDQTGRLKVSGIPAGVYLLDCETPGLAMKKRLIEVGEREVVAVEIELFSARMGMVVKFETGIVPHQK